MESSLGKNRRSDSSNSKSNFQDNSKEINSVEKLIIQIIRRKKIFIITILAFAIFGFIRTTKEKVLNSLYEGSFSLLIKDPINQSSRNMSSDGFGLLFEPGSVTIDQDIPTLRKLLLSQYILQDISKKFDIGYKNLSDRIRIEQDYKSDGVLEVTLTSNNPKDDLNLLRELSEVYVNYAILQKQRKLSDGLSFLSDQEPAIKEKNIKLRIKLEEFMKEHNLVNPVRESEAKKREIKGIEVKISELKAKLTRLDSTKMEIEKGNLNKANYIEIIGDKNNSSLQLGIQESGVVSQYETLNKKLGEAQLVYTPNSSIVKNLKSKIKSMQPVVKQKQLEAVDKSIKSTKDIIQINNEMLEKSRSDFIKLTSLIREYEVLKFELEAASDNLTGLNSVKEKLQLQIAQDSKPWTIIREPSFNYTRIYPSYKKELTSFILMGVLAGIGLCLLRERFDDVYHSPDEIRSEINLPILGHLPYIEFFSNVREEKKSLLDAFLQTKDGEVMNSYDKFFYQEALRNIYTSIRFLNSDNPIKVITITSSIPKEGKSLSSILLAKTLCEMDLKILQIDADLRKPQLHTRLRLNNITGLSNIISNEEIKISDAIQIVPGFKNWSVITSGTKPPDPTRLLQSKKMDDIIAAFRNDEKYDLVLIDSPPVIGLADSLLVSEKSDGLILVITTNQVPKSLPKESINKSLESGVNLLGIITNSTKKTNNQLPSEYAYAYNSYAEEEKADDIKREKMTKFEKVKLSLSTNIKEITGKFFKWLDA